MVEMGLDFIRMERGQLDVMDLDGVLGGVSTFILRHEIGFLHIFASTQLGTVSLMLLLVYFGLLLGPPD